MVLILSLVSIVIMLGLILYCPLQVIIHSKSNEFRIKWGSLLSVWFIPAASDLKIRIKLLTFQKDLDILSIFLSSKSKPKSQKNKRRGSFKALKNTLPIIYQSLRSFRIKQYQLELDTDNFVINAYLFPLFHFLNKGKGKWHINYNGVTELDLEMFSRPIWIIYACTKAILTKRM